jgi:phosphoribosylanthranilate isomerase
VNATNGGTGHRNETLVKICGVRTPEQALHAGASGADLIGLVFYEPSPRYVTPDRAAAVTRALRDAGSPVIPVGLFVNVPPATINAIAAEIGLGMVQLSGDEPDGAIAEIELPVLRAMRVSASEGAARMRERLAAADWTLAAALAAEYPVLLAGGLTPDNVAEAARTVRPLGVDVSSGVETDRVKDPDKVRRFIGAIRELDATEAGARLGSAPPAPQSWGETAVPNLAPFPKSSAAGKHSPPRIGGPGGRSQRSSHGSTSPTDTGNRS